MEAGGIGVVEAGPVVVSGLEEVKTTAISVEAAYPGATAVAIDIMNVLGKSACCLT